MNPPDISAGQLILVIVLSLGIAAVYPFAKAGLLYGAIRILKFRVVSYWKSFFCVLIGLGALMAVEILWELMPIFRTFPSSRAFASAS